VLPLQQVKSRGTTLWPSETFTNHDENDHAGSIDVVSSTSNLLGLIGKREIPGTVNQQIEGFTVPESEFEAFGIDFTYCIAALYIK
jgi:hypothetical protein